MSLQDRYIEQFKAEEVLSSIINGFVQNPVSRTLVALNAMDPDIALGKQKVAQAITAKGVSTQPTQALETMAANIRSIHQETVEIDGGEMYAKQLYGVKDNSIVPGYWNLYEVMAYLLSKTSSEQYSILLCEIPKGDAEYTFGTAVTPGSVPMGFVFSDDWQLNGEGSLNIHANTESGHVWNDDLDMKGNRWVAWLFAPVVEGATATTVSLGAAATNCPQPRSIHIGRHMGTITATANGVLSEIVVTDGNVLGGLNTSAYTQNWGRNVVIRNLGDLQSGGILKDANSTENIYLQASKIGGSFSFMAAQEKPCIINIVIKSEEITSSLLPSFYGGIYKVAYIYLSAKKINARIINSNNNVACKTEYLKKIILSDVDECTLNYTKWNVSQNNLTYVYIGYSADYDKTKSVILNSNYTDDAQNGFSAVENLELQSGWCKNLSIKYCSALTKSNVQDHIFDRLGVNDSGTTVTIHLATSVYDLFTAEEIAAVTTRTSITIARG